MLVEYPPEVRYVSDAPTVRQFLAVLGDATDPGSITPSDGLRSSPSLPAAITINIVWLLQTNWSTTCESVLYSPKSPYPQLSEWMRAPFVKACLNTLARLSSPLRFVCMPCMIKYAS